MGGLTRTNSESLVGVISEQPPEQVDELVALGLTPTVYTEPYLRAIAGAAIDAVGVSRDLGTGRPTDRDRSAPA